MPLRKCEECGTKMPFGRKRNRVDGRLLCNGCDPDGKGPGEGRPLGHHGMIQAFASFERDPIRSLAMQYIAHDSGDGETIYHCPFCGGGQVTGRSDGTVECDFCKSSFTVQVQPQHPGAPQTVNGEPVEWPGQPEGSADDATFEQELLDEGDDEPADPSAPPAAPGAPPEKEKPKGPIPPQFASKHYATETGHVLDADQFMRHLAIRYAADPQGVIAEVRAERQG